MPLRPTPRYLITVTADEAEAGRKFIAEGMRPPVRAELVELRDAAASLLSKLTHVVEGEEAEG